MHDDARARRAGVSARTTRWATPGADGLRFCPPRCATPFVSGHVGGRARPVCPACTYVHFRNPAPGV